MDLREQLEIIEVKFENDKKKVTFTFLDEEQGEVLDVSFNKQVYNEGKKEFVDDDEKAEKVDEWCEQYFKTPFNDLAKVVGAKMDVYHYDKFNSLWESEYPQKFDADRAGEILTGVITEITDNGQKIQIKYTIDDVLYASNMAYSSYVEKLDKWFVDPVKKENQYKRFESKFGVPVEDKDSIVGKDIMIEIKTYNGNAYGDIKKPQWANKTKGKK